MKLILQIALGYVLGSLLLDVLGFAVNQIARLNVRLVVKLLREQKPVQGKEQPTKLQEASD